MADDDSDLWPSDLVAEIPRIPATILQEQASALGKHTNNVVQGKIKTVTDEDGDFVINFILFVPTLGNYQYSLFTVWHNEELYPVRSQGVNLADENEFRSWLKFTFADERTVKIIRGLIAQARAESDIPF